MASFELNFSRPDHEFNGEWRTRLHAGRAASLRLEPTDNEDEAGSRGRVAEAAQTVKSKSAAVRNRMRDRLTAARTSAGDALHDGQDAVGKAARETREQGRAAFSAAMQLHDSNPMATASLGIAVGALLGSIIPQSSKEKAALSDVADQGLEAAAVAAKKLSEKVTAKLDPGRVSPIPQI